MERGKDCPSTFTITTTKKVMLKETGPRASKLPSGYSTMSHPYVCLCSWFQDPLQVFTSMGAQVPCVKWHSIRI